MVSGTSMLMRIIAQTQAAQPLWFRLSPEDRVRALLALALILFLGFAFALFAWWAGRWTRRYMNRPHRTGGSNAPHVDDWARKPLVADEESSSEPKG
jgi:hypothetical protein